MSNRDEEMLPIGLTRGEMDERLDATKERLAGKDPATFTVLETLLMGLVAERDAERG